MRALLATNSWTANQRLSLRKRDANREGSPRSGCSTSTGDCCFRGLGFGGHGGMAAALTAARRCRRRCA